MSTFVNNQDADSYRTAQEAREHEKRIQHLYGLAKSAGMLDRLNDQMTPGTSLPPSQQMDTDAYAEERDRLFAIAAIEDAEDSEEADKYAYALYMPGLRHCEGWFDGDPKATFVTPEEPVPLQDSSEALNISGVITALSVNMQQEPPTLYDPRTGARSAKHLPPPKVYALTLTLETTDLAAVQQLVMVRMRQNCSKKADLLVWPADY